MAAYGIRSPRLLGVHVPEIRRLARAIGRDHRLAGALWRSRVHEARLLAAMIEEPRRVTPAQARRWVRGFDNWAICDGYAQDLLWRLPFADDLVRSWSGPGPEFTRRAAFALIAELAVHDRARSDREFLRFLPLIRSAASDDRRYVRKGVSWALRQIGKRSPALRRPALALARVLRHGDSASARWIGSDATRELERHRPS